MRILIGCERSRVVSDEFAKLGHDVWSCDLLPPEHSRGNHYQGNVLDILYSEHWDLFIVFPDCTYITGSAEWAFADCPMINGKPRNIKKGTLIGAKRRTARRKALKFVRTLLDAPVDRIALENPRGKIGTVIRPADQWIHPNQFGHDASKNTGLWLKNLPKLKATKRIEGRFIEYPLGSGKIVERWANQTDSGQNILGPSNDRAMERARTYLGVGKAMAKQWG